MSPVQNDFPQPANARPPAPPADTMPTGSHATIVNHPVNLASALHQFAGQETFVLDPDLRLGLEDMASAAEGRNWKEKWPQWLNGFINDALRNYLGR